MATISPRPLLLLIVALFLNKFCCGHEVVELTSQLSRRLHGGGVHREFYCGLQDIPIINVVKNETTGKVYEIENTSGSSETHAVKPCECYEGLLNNRTYCPAESTYCSISVAYDYHYSFASRVEDHDPIVTCFRDTQLKGFARYVWKYCTIIFAALAVVLICTDTGRQVTRHALSRCIPQINTRIVEERLNMEMESQRQHFFRWRERVSEQGYVLGLKLKTKIYHPEAREDKDDLDNVGNDQGVDSCSICIIELEDGERIADLNCKHYFHADCLSEWIKKKNSCPLCQTEGIAEEVRSYDIESDELNDFTIENMERNNN